MHTIDTAPYFCYPSPYANKPFDSLRSLRTEFLNQKNLYNIDPVQFRYRSIYGARRGFIKIYIINKLQCLE